MATLTVPLKLAWHPGDFLPLRSAAPGKWSFRYPRQKKKKSKP